MKLTKLSINDTSHVGIYVSLGKDYAVIPSMVSNKEEKTIKKILDVDCIRYNIAGSQLNGVMSKLFHEKIILSKTSTKEDVDFFESKGFEVLVLDAYFAIGNLIATDQKHVIVSKEFDSKTVKRIGDFLGTKVVQYQVSQLPTIGSYLVANKNGFAVIPHAKPHDIKKLESILKVRGNIATVNYGDGFIANGLLVNDEGIIVGEKTTGYELIRITEIFYS